MAFRPPDPCHAFALRALTASALVAASMAAASCARGASLHLGKPSGVHAQFSETLRVCVRVSQADGEGELSEPVRVGAEPVRLPIGATTLVAGECGRGGQLHPRFMFALDALPDREYVLRITGYTPSLGGPEGPSRIDAMELQALGVGAAAISGQLGSQQSRSASP